MNSKLKICIFLITALLTSIRSVQISRSMCRETLNFGITNCSDTNLSVIITALPNVEEKTLNNTAIQGNNTRISHSMNQNRFQSLTTMQLALILVGSFILVGGTLSIIFFCHHYQRRNCRRPPQNNENEMTELV